MRNIDIQNASRPTSQPVRAKYCASFMCRLCGFTFRRNLTQGEALLLVQPRDSRLDASIHMLAVWTDLAVIWINNDGVVVDLCTARAWYPFYIPKQPARYILEMAASRLTEFAIGDKVTFEDVFED